MPLKWKSIFSAAVDWVCCDSIPTLFKDKYMENMYGGKHLTGQEDGFSPFSLKTIKIQDIL